MSKTLDVQESVQAPWFELPAIGNSGSHTHSLLSQQDVYTFNLSKQLEQGSIVLFFYPKDSTPGCRQEAKEFSAYSKRFLDLSCQPIGVSRDTTKSHVKFFNRYELCIPLLSDSEEGLCQAFDVIRPKKLFGKEYNGIERSTFLIGADGVIQAAWRKISVTGHVEAVFQTLLEYSS